MLYSKISLKRNKSQSHLTPIIVQIIKPQKSCSAQITRLNVMSRWWGLTIYIFIAEGIIFYILLVAVGNVCCTLLLPFHPQTTIIAREKNYKNNLRTEAKRTQTFFYTQTFLVHAFLYCNIRRQLQNIFSIHSHGCNTWQRKIRFEKVKRYAQTFEWAVTSARVILETYKK